MATTMLDNAAMKNFFGLLKSELRYLQMYQSMEYAKQKLIDYLENDNNRRIKAKLKGHRLNPQAASPFACLNRFDCILCRTLSTYFKALRLFFANMRLAKAAAICRRQIKRCPAPDHPAQTLCGWRSAPAFCHHSTGERADPAWRRRR